MCISYRFFTAIIVPMERASNFIGKETWNGIMSDDLSWFLGIYIVLVCPIGRVKCGAECGVTWEWLSLF